ncbi:hypothetical protein B7494_g1106 [Chlorociboria aeruginascens]|nr:hypothetical protein B7494_g1106 [Chlorociboria aeruginascens]
MVLQLSAATGADVDQIADIHLAAFDSNVLLHAQFPTEDSLKGLHDVLSADALSTIRDAKATGKAILVVRDTEIDKIISFARWDLPTLNLMAHNRDITWPEGCRLEYLEGYTTKAEAAKERVIGNTPCYRLTFVGTYPGFQRRGAGTMLTKWGLAKAEKENIPVYLESTITALPLYQKLGFIPIDGLSMELPDMGVDGEPVIYQELCMLRKWDAEVAPGMDRWDSSLNISSLLLDYEAGIQPQTVVQAIYERIDAYMAIQPSVWIYLQPLGEVMSAANAINSRWPNPDNRPSLWGVPFSVKDSINVAGIPTTMGCPALSFIPTESAPVYQRCIDAGALFIGKTNMEQLATGMTGCRSPYGTLHSIFSKQHIVGGSSSGGAVSVSEGLVSFALGSDTAGSIRVPALFNGIVGLKPTKGTVSARGVSPACLHQDCVSFLTLNTEDAETVWRVCEGYDKDDFFAKPLHLRGPGSLTKYPSDRKFSFRFGIPPTSALETCSRIYRKRFDDVIQTLQSAGGRLVDIDWTPFAGANELLYGGTFVTERLTILPDGWFNKNKDRLHPVTREVFEGALTRKSTAVDVFRDLHKQAEYKRAVENVLTFSDNDEGPELTVMILPTTPFHPTIEEVSKDPIGINSKLGEFAHSANVLDLVGIAIPCGNYVDRSSSTEGIITTLPFGVTVLAGCGLDAELLKLMKSVEETLSDLGQDQYE